MKLTFSQTGWDDYLYWQTQDRKTIKKINLIIQDIARSGHDGLSKPEPLRGNLSGFYSRRIDEKHRLVYRICENGCEIIQCRGHY